MSTTAQLPTVRAESGRPLYLTARDALKQAIRGGAFRPGQRMPSTKVLSRQLHVSLVTAHRAMQELVHSGVVRRSQGKGTYVHADFYHRLNTRQTRIGVVLHPESPISEHHLGQIMQGVRLAASAANVDLVLPRSDEDWRNECHGFLLLTPHAHQIESLADHVGNKPFVVAGAVPPSMDVSSVKVDNHDIGLRGMDHLCGLGHRRIAYIGADDTSACGRERWEGFLLGCARHGRAARQELVIRSRSSRLDDREHTALMRILSAPRMERPTAVFASGFGFAVDVYSAVRQLELHLPDSLSVLAVDDPPGAAHMFPSLTTFDRPLIPLGQAAMTTLLELIQSGSTRPIRQRLLANLVIRGSTSRLY